MASSNPVFVEASPPEILRSAQKDESYIAHLKKELSEILQQLLSMPHPPAPHSAAWLTLLLGPLQETRHPAGSRLSPMCLRCCSTTAWPPSSTARPWGRSTSVCFRSTRRCDASPRSWWDPFFRSVHLSGGGSSSAILLDLVKIWKWN